MNLAIIGSRGFTDLPYAVAIFEGFCEVYEVTKVISGGAKGADTIAEKIAKVPVTVIKPDWQRYGRGAGMIRNNAIIEACDKALVFWDGKSTGTRDSINKLAKAKKGFLLVRYDIDEWEWFGKK